MCLRVLAVLFLPSSRLRELFDSHAETLLGAAQRVFTMSARGVPPFPSPVPEGFHTPDQTVSIRGHESAAERELSTEHQPEHDRFEGMRESAGGGSGLVACPGRRAKSAKKVVQHCVDNKDARKKSGRSDSARPAGLYSAVLGSCPTFRNYFLDD